MENCFRPSSWKEMSNQPRNWIADSVKYHQSLEMTWKDQSLLSMLEILLKNAQACLDKVIEPAEAVGMIHSGQVTDYLVLHLRLLGTNPWRRGCQPITAITALLCLQIRQIHRISDLSGAALHQSTHFHRVTS